MTAEMDQDALYRIWLQNGLGVSNPYAEKILQKYKTAESFYRKGSNEWAACGILNRAQVQRLKESGLDKAGEILQICEETGIWILTIDDPRYPERLRNIVDAHALLYVKGNLPAVDEEVCFAMVGTRNATVYGVEIASQMAEGIAQAGGIVVSGGAKGIDTASHRGALKANGTTIVVLGCGINYPYLQENLEMRQAVCEKGAILSEHPPEEAPRPYHFPLRNRIISGLSVATLVVEAGKRSGSLITARLALEQGRDVLAVPGSILSEKSNGTNTLIQEGAKSVATVQDVLEEYVDRFSGKLRMKNTNVNISWHRPKNRLTREELFGEQLNFEEEPIQPQTEQRPERSPEKKPTKSSAKTPELLKKYPAPKPEPLSEPVSPAPKETEKILPAEKVLPGEKKASVAELSLEERDVLSETAQKIIRVMTAEPTHIDELAAMTGLNVQNALAAVTELELMGFIRSHSGKRFSR